MGRNPANLRLTLACGDYDINQGLITGEVGVQGVDLVALTMSSPERHWRLLRHREFDICELSLSGYLAMRDTHAEPYVAVPVFPHRRFRHSYVFVNRDAGIRTPKDLEGKAVGLRTWQTSAGLWTRGILKDHYGVDIASIHWLAQDDEAAALDPRAMQTFDLGRVPEGKDVDQMLLSGELQGLIYPELPPSYRKGDSRIQHLFPDPKAEEMRFFQATGLFPIMHTVVIRESLLAQYPWLAMEVVKAFRKSKDRAWKAMEDPRRVSLAWFREALEEQRVVLGRDPWPYDLPNNEVALRKACEWSYEQGMTSRLLTIEDLFHPASIDEPPQYVGA